MVCIIFQVLYTLEFNSRDTFSNLALTIAILLYYFIQSFDIEVDGCLDLVGQLC